MRSKARSEAPVLEARQPHRTHPRSAWHLFWGHRILWARFQKSILGPVVPQLLSIGLNCSRVCLRLFLSEVIPRVVGLQQLVESHGWACVPFDKLLLNLEMIGVQLSSHEQDMLRQGVPSALSASTLCPPSF